MPRRRTAAPAAPPRFIEPMQCQAVADLPKGEWTYELKFDGYRCIAVKVGSEVTLYSRNEKILNARFPGVVEALRALSANFAIDGELVALDAAGRPSFQLLQNNVSRDLAVYFYAFDLLNDGRADLTGEPIEHRRARLEEFLADTSEPVRRSPILQGTPAEILAAVQRLGLEGVVGKRAGSKYEAGERAGTWIKYRTNREQEFVVGGFIPGNRGIDALLVGVYEQGQLRYVAKVRSGFVPRVREQLARDLQKLAAQDCPFVNLPEPKASRWGEALTAEKMKECRWVQPQMVVQVAFVEWTDAGHLRHCTFVGVREDVEPGSVVRETYEERGKTHAALSRTKVLKARPKKPFGP